ncbi:MAG: TolC family protein, partial [Candidatus Zixiibacteriota bacterium]
ILSVFAANPLEAEILTLDDCIELALKNRASIIAARGQETLARWDQRTALGAFLPRVSASYSYSESDIRDIKSDELRPTGYDVEIDTLVVDIDTSVVGVDSFEIVGLSPTGFEKVEVELEDQDRTSKQLDLTASMSLFDISNFFNYAAAGAARAKAHLDVIDSEQDLIYGVKTSYYAYLATVENLGVQEEAVKRSEEQLKLIQSKYELGSAAKSDVLKQKVQYGNDKLALLRGQNAVTTTRADLAYTIGVDPNSDVEFSTEYKSREFHGSLQEAIEFGLSHEPSLLAAQKSVDAARHTVRSRWGDYLPDLTGFASLGWSDGTRGDTVIYNFSSRSATIGFNVSYNIFDGFLRERNLSLAKVRHNDARAWLADTRNLVTRDIKTAYLEIGQLKEQKNVANENVAAAEEDMKITQEKYNLGAATILDLLDAQVSLKDAQVQLIRADFDLNLAIAKLERAMGKM